MTDEPNVRLGLTPEQYQLALQFESIFMPHARRQRLQARFGDDPAGKPIRFVHCTSAEAALSIIKSKRIWMRNTTCMSDYREVQHGLVILNKFFANKVKTDPFIAALDGCHQGAALEAIGRFNQLSRDIQFNTYIASISEHDDKEDSHGRLSMWRAFGGNTARVAIVFRIPGISAGSLALNLLFSPVAYLTEIEVHNLIGEITENISKGRDFLRSAGRQVIVELVFYTFLAAAVCLKHEGFREEREWRAIYSPKLRPSSLMESSTEVIGGVPQLIYKLPMDVTASPVLADIDFAQMFDRIIIGPSPYPWAMYNAFVAALREGGFQEAEKLVVVSEIPIRA